MAIFENFGKKVGKVANDAAIKSKKLADIARTSVAMNDERSAIRNLYRDIGEKYYRDLRDTDMEDLQPLCEKVDEAQARLLELGKKLNQVMGVRICEACGDTIDKRSHFCPACGNPMPAETGESPPQSDEPDHSDETTTP